MGLAPRAHCSNQPREPFLAAPSKHSINPVCPIVKTGSDLSAGYFVRMPRSGRHDVEAHGGDEAGSGSAHQKLPNGLQASVAHV